MTIKNFVEMPWDEYDNVGYTAGQKYVIKARVEIVGKAGTLGHTVLHVLEPEHIKKSWPTLAGYQWKEVDYPAGIISDEIWSQLTRP